jgi:hypothetical protein
MAARKPLAERNRDRTFSLPPDVDVIVDAVPVGQRSPWVAAAIREKASREVA